MIGYLVRRLFQIIPVVIVASILIWAIIYAIPGDPVAVMLGDNASPDQIAAETRRLGLDRPVWVQYWSWITSFVQGDVGTSLISKQPVGELVARRILPTVQLGLAAVVVGVTLSVPLAMVSAVWPGSAGDRFVRVFSGLTLGIPTFWMGILLILLFAVRLGWLPSVSSFVPIWEDPAEAIRLIILPATTLGLYVSGIFARFLRASLLSELRSDYVRTARSKGVRERLVVTRHALRNALLPFVTVVGLQTGNFIGGSVVTESVFNYPGLGRAVVNAISQRDYPMIQGTILVILLLYIVVNVVVDVSYGYLDPRIEHA